jgi:hypothetical protein
VCNVAGGSGSAEEEDHRHKPAKATQRELFQELLPQPRVTPSPLLFPDSSRGPSAEEDCEDCAAKRLNGPEKLDLSSTKVKLILEKQWEKRW